MMKSVLILDEFFAMTAKIRTLFLSHIKITNYLTLKHGTFKLRLQGIGEIQRDQQPTQRMARTLCKDGWVRLIGLTPNKPVSLYATDGRLLKRFVPTSTETAVYLEGYRGIVIGRQP